MKKLTLFLLLMAPLFMTSSPHAVTYHFPEHEPAYLKNETVMKIGTKLYLLHSGTEDVKKAINVNDILIVFQEYPPDFSMENRETGKVKIISSLGGYYFEAEVIAGEMQPGYLAKKGTVACFITSFQKNDQHW